MSLTKDHRQPNNPRNNFAHDEANLFLKGRFANSVTGRASISARNRTVLSDFAPRRTAVTEVSDFPVVISRPSPSSAAMIFA